MDTTVVASQFSTSYVYEDLILKVQSIQTQMMQMETELDKQLQGNRAKSEVKSRRFRFVDPFGNQTEVECLDHESIVKVLKNYKKNYVPKYLQQWIRLSIMNGRSISPLSEANLKSTVSDFPEDQLFVAYGQVYVWIAPAGLSFLRNITVTVLMADNAEAIQAKIKQQHPFTDIELKTATVDQNQTPNSTHWTEGVLLKPESTTMSSQLFQEHRVLLAKINTKKVSEKDLSSHSTKWDCCVLKTNAGTQEDFVVFVKTFGGTSTKLHVNRHMQISIVKQLLQEANGIPPHQQRLIFSGSQLEGDQTLSDYNIVNESIVYLVLRLRGGMYHLSSGRHDFCMMPPWTAASVINVLNFEFENVKEGRASSSAELQNAILQARTLLLKLYKETERYCNPNEIPNLRQTILSRPLGDLGDSESDNDDEDAASSS